MVQIQFECGQEDRMSQVFGPYEYIQFTYNTCRVGPEGERELAFLSETGQWTTEDKQVWSDITITPC